MIGRYVVFLAVVLGVLVTAVARKPSAPPSWPTLTAQQSLKFSHSFHINEVGGACVDCHPGAQTSASSSDNLRSTHDECMSCHEEQLSENCGYCHVDPDNIEAKVPPLREIIFSHQGHLGLDGLDCATCHPGMERVEYATPKNMPTMETCYGCHNDVKATNACEACHTSLAGLVPSDHLVSNFAREHKRASRLGALELDCASCHSQTFCADCHSAADLLQFGAGNELRSDPSPRGSPSDRPQQMKLTRAHDLNYRFTHGVDANQRAMDCYSCHNEQEFCAPCHLAGDITTNSFRPAWHNGADFATVGRGSGGGRHADFARRDIQSCITCHDVEGMDATCVTCHVDGDGIRGTDPRTHPAGFQEGEQGSWHSNPGASCYNCHTDFNARPDGQKGRGFCGYCHSS